MQIFSEEDKILLKKIIKIIAESGKCSLDKPKRFFLETMFCFQKAGGTINAKKAIWNFTREEMAFMEIINELGIKLKKGSLAEYPKTIVTRKMLSGAKGAQARHNGILKYDL